MFLSVLLEPTLFTVLNIPRQVSPLSLVNKSHIPVKQFYHCPPVSPVFSLSKGEMEHVLHLLVVYRLAGAILYEDRYQRSSIAKTLNGWIWCLGVFWAL